MIVYNKILRVTVKKVLTSLITSKMLGHHDYFIICGTAL